MIRKNMTNGEIYSIASQVVQYVTPANLVLPIKVNFYLQKNISSLMSIAEDIEKSRTEILQRYGKQDEVTGNYDFENDEQIQKANSELQDLFSLEQEVPIYEISLETFGDAVLESQQMKAILYMIKEEE